jgi:hypothetical protein
MVEHGSDNNDDLEDLEIETFMLIIPDLIMAA